MLHDKSYFIDPIYNVVDPRPVAEFAKSAARLGELNVAKKCFDWIISVQNKDGSWNEILTTEFSQESCVATGVIGRMLLIGYELLHKKSYLRSALKAAKYIHTKEFLPGYYIKSYLHYSDVLNVNATVATFLQKAYEITREKKFAKARDRAIFNVIKYQFKDGAYPYASRINTYPYENHLNFRDAHYHALTLYFLLLADPYLSNKFLSLSYKKSIAWLKDSYRFGKLDWSKDEHIFSIGVTGAYGYALFCAEFAKDSILSEKIERHISKIQRRDGLYNRYEKPTIIETVKSVMREVIDFDSIAPKNFGFATKLLRIRQKLSRNLKVRKKPQISVYYSAQILDCLTEINYVLNK
ncbi:MAG: hypothetical protein J4445_00580 [DPANN group archaeon]|nr:hypothetical protein [DPANN group archaeon]